jgi:hypothetical protein
MLDNKTISKDLAKKIQDYREELEAIVIRKRQLEEAIFVLTSAKIHADNN